MLFVDFKQDFDSVDRGMTVLESYGIPPKLMNIIQQLYRNTSCKVLHRGKTGHGFGIKSGVKQFNFQYSSLLFFVFSWIC